MPLFGGIDVGGSRIKYGLVGGSGAVLFNNQIPTPGSAVEFFVRLEEIWTDLWERGERDIAAVGMGLPGIFSSRDQRIIRSPHCPFLDGLDLQSHLPGIFGTPLVLHNEANLAAYGEYAAGSGTGAESLVLITVGSGIGAGILIRGEIWEGACGFAGELGHVSVFDGGRPCACGNTGCLETEVSAQAVIRTYLHHAPSRSPVTVEDVVIEAERGDAAARGAFERIGRYLGIGLSIIANIIGPELILLGGGVMGASNFLLPAALSEAKKRTFKAVGDCSRILPAALGNEAGFIGAALWARKRPRG